MLSICKIDGNLISGSTLVFAAPLPLMGPGNRQARATRCLLYMLRDELKFSCILLNLSKFYGGICMFTPVL